MLCHGINLLFLFTPVLNVSLLNHPIILDKAEENASGLLPSFGEFEDGRF